MQPCIYTLYRFNTRKRRKIEAVTHYTNFRDVLTKGMQDVSFRRTGIWETMPSLRGEWSWFADENGEPIAGVCRLYYTETGRLVEEDS